MYIIYEGNLTPGSLPIATDKQFQGIAAGIFKLPLDCLYLNIYNISPHRLTFSFSGGNNDWYFPPNSEAEGIYIGKQGGANLSLAPKMQSAVSLQITNLFTLSTLLTVTGVLAVMGFKEGEIWQGRRPIVTGSIVPTQGANVSSQLVNVGNSQGTNVINTSSSPGAGSININNDGSGDVKLLDSGLVPSFIHLVNGTNVAPAVAAFGTPNDLLATTFNGQGNLGLTSIGQLTNAGSVACIGHWITIARGNRVHITANGLTNILALPAPVTGRYRASGYINKIGGTASALTFLLTWQDPDDSLSHGQNFSCDNVGVYLNLRGVTTLGTVVLNPFPMEFDATIGQNIVIAYNDPTGTPNDYVSATLDCWVI